MKGLGFIKSFLPHHMKRQVRELFMARILVNLALAMVMIFEPIYLYQIGYSLQYIMLFYMITYGIYLVGMPLGAKFAKSKGYEPAMMIGTFLYIAFYITLFFVAQVPMLFYIAPVILALQKIIYWPAYHSDFAAFSDDDEEGREISSMEAATSMVFILGPALAGFIIVTWGYGALFTIASLLFLVSNIPTMITKEEFKKESFSYREVFRYLFSKINRKTLLAYVGFGEELILLTVWPVFISLIIIDAFDLGLIIALATLVTTVLTFYIGKLSDMRNKRSILALGSTFYSFAWFIRIFITNTVGVFFVDSLSRLGKNTVNIPLMAITYENAKKQKMDSRRHVMKSIVFFEMSLVIGKLLAIIAIFVLTSIFVDEIFAFKLSFILAGGMTLLYLLL